MRFTTYMGGLWLLLPGCVGYSDASTLGTDASDASPVEVEEDGQVLEEDEPDAAEKESDGGVESGVDDDAGAELDVDVVMGHSSGFDGYLMDRLEQPLYMFVEDVAGSERAACLSDCADEWPPFDVDPLRVGPGMLSNEFTRFHRQDGDWQVAYKGHPLYYRAAEAGEREVTGDGVDGSWFVARDYLAFLGRSMSFTPAGSATFDAVFLTNGFGRTLYICLADAQGSALTLPVSSCLGDCARRHPLWSNSEASRTTILPSVMAPADLSEFQRPDGAVQLTYRGWPVYYFGNDQNVGDILGHNQEAWRAVDPVSFGAGASSP